MSSFFLLAFACCIVAFVHSNANTVDYGAALTKSLLYYEAQRSGKLPPNQRVKWRGDSTLNDGKDAGVDLGGGYYDAGDNVKFGFPMAYTVTMLAWSVVEFGSQLEAKKELANALAAIKWGTDYFIKAHPYPNVLYGQAGDGDSDHACWMRPEDMTTPRTVYRIDEQNPGADLAGETAAAFAASALAFRRTNPKYSAQLILHAKQLFNFAVKHPGQYQNSIPPAGKFYSSSGYEDELLWAALWLERATGEKRYLDFINTSTNSGGTRTEFSWDDKYVGVQLLVAKGILEGRYPGNGNLGQYKNYVEQFICNCIQKGSSNIKASYMGLLWWQPSNNLQYVTSASFIMTTYSSVLAATKNTLRCPTGKFDFLPEYLISEVHLQVNYILGLNPYRMSYMVGFGTKYPKEVHHRGASIVSIKKDSNPVTCQNGFNAWFHRNAPNPNVLDGAIVGGPGQTDEYTDSRDNYQQAEAAIANTAPLVGVLAYFASLKTN
ncbi:endoglucanase 14-like [Olea europaea var. sylvestris]|uniref:Endoglucanase n=1 Tax=Olea europaea subsp. europaea TaxID=158383 RepID=A0A8S0PA39_OLEEU|nr:endoglucanase 14-like [Olea europaea var. sylvestris]CAA2934837.1 endoglucanase 14-like [Olea europaea subsp. europaea]